VDQCHGVHTTPIAQKVDAVVLQVDVDGRIKEMRRAILIPVKYTDITHQVTGRRLQERQQPVQRVLTNAFGGYAMIILTKPSSIRAAVLTFYI
jgi:hypothetical protein